MIKWMANYREVFLLLLSTAFIVTCGGCYKTSYNASPEQKFVNFVEGENQAALLIKTVKILEPLPKPNITDNRVLSVIDRLNEILQINRSKKYSIRGHEIWETLEELVLVEVSLSNNETFTASMGFFEDDVAVSIEIKNQSLFSEEVYPFIFELQ